MSSMSPLITAVSPPSLLIMRQTFLNIFFNLSLTKANLTSITSLIKDANFTVLLKY